MTRFMALVLGVGLLAGCSTVHVYEEGVVADKSQDALKTGKN
jgi:uncharacterized lipoprotein